MELYPSLIKIKEKNMATYRIDVPTAGGTITAATFNTSCVDNVSIDLTHDPDQMIKSTGVTSDGKVTIDCYGALPQMTSRDWEFPLTYNSGSNSCSHTLHLYQTGETPSEEITLEYQINIPNYQDNGNLYLCTHTLQGNSHARELFTKGVALHLLVGQMFDVDTFVATKTNGRCKFKEVQTMGIVNDTSNGGVTVTNFSEDTPYYVVVVNNAEGQYSIFGTQANLKTQQFDSAGDCSNYVQDIN